MPLGPRSEQKCFSSIQRRTPERHDEEDLTLTPGPTLESQIHSFKLYKRTAGDSKSDFLLIFSMLSYLPPDVPAYSFPLLWKFGSLPQTDFPLMCIECKTKFQENFSHGSSPNQVPNTHPGLTSWYEMRRYLVPSPPRMLPRMPDGTREQSTQLIKHDGRLGSERRSRPKTKTRPPTKSVRRVKSAHYALP